ncbi:DEAD/DEAH box helicase [Exiguobacterium sp. SL-9]|uniref:DEAD/DEAH box helicase n=1 Tax=Exiguobacterium sp. SL-9 TaxID=2510963 RepID=UPI00137619C8|nr:DEAD/DEAH box helicase [Exiguobacterium sp. SL-9]
MRTLTKINIETLRNQLENAQTPNKVLFVFFGFSPEDVQDLNEYKLLNDAFPQPIESFKNSPDILTHVAQKIGTSKDFFWCTAEEYQFYIRNQLDNFFDIHLLYNNLYHSTFPIFYTFENFNEVLNDFEEEDREITSSNFEAIIKFYSNVFKLDKVYASYSIDQDILEAMTPYFDGFEKVDKLNNTYPAYDLVIELQEDQTEFLLLTDKLLNSQSKQIVNIVHSNLQDIYINHYSDRLSVLKMLNDNIVLTFTQKSLSVKKFDESKYLSLLDEYFGYSSFRNLSMYKDPDHSKELVDVSQSQIIHDIVEEIENAQKELPFKDIFITSSTGAGKSVMFQLPSFLIYKEYQLLTIVISPLIGLMNDQVKNLKDRGIHNVATINSNVTPAEKAAIQERIRNKEIAILYISPETLLGRSDIKMLIGNETKVGLFIVDEAHIVTTWGKAFRSDYWYLGPYLKKLRKEMKFPIATFTATAIYGGEEDMYKETRDSLGLINPKFYLGKVKRDDIEMKIDMHTKDLKTNEYQRAKFEFVSRRLKVFMKEESKVLVYFPTIPLIRQLQTYIEEHHPRLAKEIVQYYGSLDKANKDGNHSRFSAGDAKIMFATKAYGMGIDLPDINVVYHYAPTGNVCDYVQEIGRAARDESISGQAYFDFLKNDFSHIKRLHGMSTIRRTQLQLVAQKIYNIYKEKKRSRNLLVNVEDFAYIFTSNNRIEDIDVEGKLKTALLLIEKDFVNKIGYAPFVARPRGLFSREYFTVTAQGEKLLQQIQNRPYAKFIRSIKSNLHTAIYELNLKEIWEKKYRNLSFPDFKRRFHERDDMIKLNFLNEIDPTFVVNFQSSNSLESASAQFNQRLQSISQFFSQYALTNTYFTSDQLAFSIQKSLKLHKYEAASLAQVFLHSMVRFNVINQNTNAKSVIRHHEVSGYQVGPAYEDFFKFLQRQTLQYLTSQVDQQTDGSYNIYLSKSVRNAMDRLSITFGILEAFKLITYQIQGGNTPEIYIRINSTLTLESLIKNPEKYQNQILNNVHYRHKLSIEMLKYIFENKMDTATFWEVIEDYFLGSIPEEVVINAKTIK